MSREYSFNNFPYSTSHYSVLEQATTCELPEVEKIIESEENDRRSLFEESAFMSDVVTDAVFSMYYESKRCKLVCALFGPLSNQSASIIDTNNESHSNIVYRVRFSPFCFKRERLGHSECENDSVLSQNLANIMNSALMFSEDQIGYQWVFEVKVLSHDMDKINFIDGSTFGFGSSVLPAAVNCASIAFSIAGLPMKGLIAASTILLISFNEKEKHIINPSGNALKDVYILKNKGMLEVAYAAASFITFGSIDDRMLCSYTNIGTGNFQLATKILLDSTWRIHSFQKDFIEKYSNKKRDESNTWL